MTVVESLPPLAQADLALLRRRWGPQDLRERDFHCAELRALLDRLLRTLTPNEKKRLRDLRRQAINRFYRAARVADENSKAPTRHARAAPR